MKRCNDYFRNLNVGLPEDIARLKAAGYFEAAIELIDIRLAEDWAARQNSRPYQGLAASGEMIADNPMAEMPICMREALTVQREMMCRIPQCYPYTEQDAFDILQSKISAFTEEEFGDLFNENRLDWRFVNGAPHVSEDFYDTLIDTDASYAARAGVPHSKERSAQRDASILQMQQEGSVKANYTLRASVTVSEDAFAQALAQAKAAGKSTVTVRAWLPFPAGCDSQKDIVLQQAMPQTYTSIAPEDTPARSVYWTCETAELPAFSLEYTYTQVAKYTALPQIEEGDICEAKTLCSEKDLRHDAEFASFLAQEAPHLCFTPYLRALVAELTQGLTTPLAKARAIYDYITFNVHYRYMPAYFTLENIAENCAMSRRGDCGVMAITFITMCRIAGIPAQWESGLMVSKSAAGCHDWARFYIAPYGWLYADCSYGSSAAREESELRRTHYFGNLDAGRMVANNAFMAPLTPPKDGWRADPCDNQCGEIELDGVGIFGKDLITKVEVLSAE